jgi:hypothetical protein
VCWSARPSVGTALQPWAAPLTAAALTELCRCCLVLARLEQFFRASTAVWGQVVTPFHRVDGGFHELATALFADATVLDLERLAPAIVEDHQDLRSCEPLDLNPTFGLSDALAGADADLIAAGLLLDFKATAGTRIVSRHELWQLVGYALADTEDRYGIHSVGISALRWRTWELWPLDTLLGHLGTGPPRSVSAWRAAFARLLAGTDLDLGRGPRTR